MLVHGLPEFEGKPGVQGSFEKLGLLHEHPCISGMLIVVHPWHRPAELWGLFRERDWVSWSDQQNHPSDNIFTMLQPKWNDDLGSMGWSCKHEIDRPAR